MWLAFAFGSAFFAGITAILAKIGIKNIDSTLATALRTIVVAVFAWVLVFMIGSYKEIPGISQRSFIFLTLSGLSTGASWLCYFRALQMGDVNKVTPADKSSTILAILLAILFLGEPFALNTLLGMIGIAIGTLMMLEIKKEGFYGGKRSGNSKNAGYSGSNSGNDNHSSSAWLFFAILSAVFAALTSILGKIGIQEIESNLGTAIRTLIVLALSWIIVFAGKKQNRIAAIDRRSWLFLILSGVATGLSWLCFFRALQDGDASVVVPIDKLSIVVTVIFSVKALKEKITDVSLTGLLLIVAGTLTLLL